MGVERRVRKESKRGERKRSKERDDIWWRKNENDRKGERVKRKGSVQDRLEMTKERKGKSEERERRKFGERKEWSKSRLEDKRKKIKR